MPDMDGRRAKELPQFMHWGSKTDQVEEWGF